MRKDCCKWVNPSNVFETNQALQTPCPIVIPAENHARGQVMLDFLKGKMVIPMLKGKVKYVPTSSK